MTLLDGRLGKRSFMERVLDSVLDSRKLVATLGIVCAVCVLASPVVMLIDFRYFTATMDPWWLNVIDYSWTLGFIFSGLCSCCFCWRRRSEHALRRKTGWTISSVDRRAPKVTFPATPILLFRNAILVEL